MLNGVYVVIEQLVAVGGLPTGIGKANLAERSKAHLSGFAPERIPQEPRLRALASDLQIEPSTVRIHTGALSFCTLVAVS